MKQFVKIVALGAAAALALVSCQKNEQNYKPSNPVRFFAESIETKTTFGELEDGKYPTLWTGDEEVAISLNKAGSVKYTVKPLSGGKTAEFVNASGITNDESGNYTFYAISPYSATVNKINATYNSWTLKVSAIQTPLDNSVDPAAQILFGKNVTGEEFPEEVAFDFTHITAYGKMTFANLGLDEDEKVNLVTLEASEAIAGNLWLYVEEGEYNEGETAPASSNTSKVISINTDKTENIWFACAPVNLSGKDMTITVSTNKGSFTKTINFGSYGQFTSGKVAKFSINMEGVERQSPKAVYTLVENLDDLTLGSEFILVDAVENIAAGAIGSNKKLSPVAITVSDKKISDPVGATVFTIGNGTAAGTYAFFSEEKALTWESSTNINLSDLSDNSNWVITISGGTMRILNLASSRVLLTNTTSNNAISAYVENDGYNYIAIYKNMETGSGAITPKAPVSLSVSDQTMTFSVGDSFEFDGTVNVVYSDGSTGILSSKEFTVDYSSVDMDAAGSYPVTVSYVEDPSISVTFNVEVESTSALVVWMDDFSVNTEYKSSISSLSGSLDEYEGEYSGLTKVHSVPGAINVGNASAEGSITTPALTTITSTSANLTITFKAAGWNGKTAKLTVTTSKGTVTEGETTITSESTMKGTEPTMTGTEYTFHVSGADNTTTITFSTNTRIGIDDLVIKQTN